MNKYRLGQDLGCSSLYWNQHRCPGRSTTPRGGGARVVLYERALRDSTTVIIDHTALALDHSPSKHAINHLRRHLATWVRFLILFLEVSLLIVIY